jgi:hypothetical protein
MAINGRVKPVWGTSCIENQAQSYKTLPPGMLILITIFLFIFIPPVMLIFRLARPKFSIQGFLVILALIAGLVMVILAHSEIPAQISLLHWQPETLFPISPALLIDPTSWYLALAVVSLAFCIAIASIAQIGVSVTGELHHATDSVRDVQNDQEAPDADPSSAVKAAAQSGSISNWQLWAAILILSGISLVAVFAGNLLTLMLAWAALDFLELLTLLSQTLQARVLERVVLVFSAKLAGLAFLLISGLVLWSQNGSLAFTVISPAASVMLLIAGGIRLGVLPLQLPFAQGLPMNRHLGSALRLIPAASSYVLLVRVSNIGIRGEATPFLLGLAALAGIYTGFRWLASKDELEGRPYWLLGSGSLIVAAAILNMPIACLAWSIASLLSGGLIFSMALRHRHLLPLIVLGAISLSTLPFSPTWQGATLYQFPAQAGVSLTLFSILSLLFLFTQAFLLAGFIRHSLSEIYPINTEKPPRVERWVWFVYPFGLTVIVIVDLIFGYLLLPDFINLPVAGWVIGPLTLIIAAFTLFFFWRYPQPIAGISTSLKPGILDRVFSLNWFYGFFGKLFHLVSNFFTLSSTILEGEGGILWAVVLFVLILVFLQR